MSGQQKVQCTYADCPALFSSIQAMKKHKAQGEHDYCSRCDEDFEDEERLLIHKIKSNKHIVCPICGVDFRSEGGRDGHIRQNHRAEQTIICHGCKDIFKSASGLMRHIEEDECPAISKTRLLQEQSKKLIIKEALKAGEGSPMPIIPNPVDFDDIDGGVKVNMLEMENREAMAHQPKPGEVDPTASVDAMLALKHWPQLGEQRKMGSEAASPGSDLMAFSDFSPSVRSPSVWKGKEKARSVTETEVQSPTREEGPFGVGLPDAGQMLRIMNESWDPTKFFNSFSGKYACPCGALFTGMKEFEEHILMKSRARRNMQCPACLRIFKSTAALIAHCESASVRCSINDGYRYGQIIDELSGGVIQASGYNNDGTVKYEAGKLALPNNTMIGTDLQAVKKW
ncbi:hypothetical protein ASPWEDRAFT_67784 [Aspergillus wentii DTO 134E9]|uniref:C2H2-type domain-containing protein n=1 Tax=Aspergillus wentii DTO 134E9 TaxID=1073089 RepID=A0A1L9RRT7_ASPWE|nr:uncharacterized protein ASPWEDRAFT_67784 [Aspergillus wentii DTO 134E9]OJJ37583.1 hypothetical protein ASPWEDRAFT_67784 [Aspergillus wentii DTO 134E9]